MKEKKSLTGSKRGRLALMLSLILGVMSTAAPAIGADVPDVLLAEPPSGVNLPAPSCASKVTAPDVVLKICKTEVANFFNGNKRVYATATISNNSGKSYYAGSLYDSDEKGNLGNIDGRTLHWLNPGDKAAVGGNSKKPVGTPIFATVFLYPDDVTNIYEVEI